MCQWTPIFVVEEDRSENDAFDYTKAEKSVESNEEYTVVGKHGGRLLSRHKEQLR